MNRCCRGVFDRFCGDWGAVFNWEGARDDDCAGLAFFIKNWGGSISIPVQQMVFGAGTQPTIRGGGHVSRK